MIDSGLGTMTISHSPVVQYHWGQDRVIAVRDSSTSPTLDQYEGYTIRFTSGDAVGVQRMLRGNATDGTYEFNVMISSYTDIPAIGDTFVIEKPGTILQTSTNSIFSATSKGRGGKGDSTVQLGLYQIQLDHAAGSGEGYFKFDGVKVRAINTWFTGISSGYTGILVANGGAWWATGVDGAYDGDTLSDNLFSLTTPYDTLGVGSFFKKTTCSTGGLFIQDHSVGGGFFVGRNSKMWAQNSLFRNVHNLSWRGCKLDLEAGSGLVLYNYYAPTGRIDSASYGIQLNILSWAQINGPLDISDSAPGMSITNSSYAYITNLIGTGNTYGITVEEFSRLAEGAGNTITGSSGDIAVAGLVTSHADVYTNDIPLWGGTGGVAMKNTSTALPVVRSGPTTIGSGGTEIDSSIRCTDTLDTNLIAAGTTVSQSVSCSGAVVGAECSVGGPSSLEAGLTLSCVVSAADTVDLRVANVTVGGITPAGSQTASVRVWNP
jgi:hypothetical protein